MPLPRFPRKLARRGSIGNGSVGGVTRQKMQEEKLE
jgi:hypothetical protein